MTVEFFVYFQFLLCFIAGVVDWVRVTVKDVSRWNGVVCEEKGFIGNHPKQLKRGRVKAGLFAQTLVLFGLLFQL